MVIKEEDTIWRLLRIKDLKINSFVKFGGNGGFCIKVSHGLQPKLQSACKIKFQHCYNSRLSNHRPIPQKIFVCYALDYS
jgi:hypothetical protein